MGNGDDEMDDGMRCSYHPYRSNQGGICASCLQEKLGKLVSSSSPVPLRASSASSSSSSFRSDTGGGAATSSTRFVAGNGGDCRDHHHAGGTRIPFLVANKKKKKPEVDFRRSKSTTTPGRGKYVDPYDGGDYIPKSKSWIWSLFDLSSSSSKSHSSKKIEQNLRESSKIASLPTTAIAAATTAAASAVKQKEKCSDSAAVEDDDGDGSPDSTQATASVSSFERKVSRSRSVGCGSRSFSGDFFERISTGFGDCTLRRVESHREGKPKPSTVVHRDGSSGGGDSQCLKERIKCGGIFGGFMIHTSSSSSSASSSHRISSSTDDTTGRFPPAAVGRNKNKGWAFASPMRAFGKPSSMEGKRDNNRESSDKNSTPNLDAIPSLLAVRI